MSARKKAWQEFSSEIEATYVKGGIFKSERIDAAFQNWQIVYDYHTFVVGPIPFIYTRIRTPFKAKSEFKFHIFKKSFVNKIGESLGKSDADVQTGDSRFDEVFVVRTSDAEKAKKLFSDENLRNLLLEKAAKIDLDFELTHGYNGSIGRHLPKNCDGLCLTVQNECRDREQLVLIYEIFGEMLTALLESGDICDEPIDVKL